MSVNAGTGQATLIGEIGFDQIWGLGYWGGEIFEELMHVVDFLPTYSYIDTDRFGDRGTTRRDVVTGLRTRRTRRRRCSRSSA